MNCAKCGQEIREQYHINGQDYCSNCQRSIPRRPGPFDEEVNGTVIGGDDVTLYRFYDDGGRKLAETKATSDHEAVEWFQINYPEHYARGVEMRAYDI